MTDDHAVGGWLAARLEPHSAAEYWPSADFFAFLYMSVFTFLLNLSFIHVFILSLFMHVYFHVFTNIFRTPNRHHV